MAFNSDEEEKYYNIDEMQLYECDNMQSFRDQQVKTFRPGNMQDIKKRNLPDAPGTGKVLLCKKNKPSKRRVNVSPHLMQFKGLKDNDEYKIYSDVGGDGGDQYLYDYEEFKKVMQH